MKCPYCTHTFPLTWRGYFKAPTGRHICPLCFKTSKLKFRALTFAVLLIVGLICSVPGAIPVNRWLGPSWRGLGVLPSLIVLLPLARMFDDRHKELRAIESIALSDIAACAECHGVFNVQDMIPQDGFHVCASCKPILLQKLSEGAAIGSAPDREKY